MTQVKNAYRRRLRHTNQIVNDATEREIKKELGSDADDFEVAEIKVVEESPKRSKSRIFLLKCNTIVIFLPKNRMLFHALFDTITI